jgi:hypothetical protein
MLIAVMVLLVSFVVGTDMWDGVSVDFNLVYLLFIFLGLAAGSLASRFFDSRLRWLPLGLYLVALGALPFVDTIPVKPAKRAVHAIRQGMTEAEVIAILNQNFPENGRFRRPNFGSTTEGRLAFSLDPSDGRYNAAIVSVEFTNGRVVTASFSPD